MDDVRHQIIEEIKSAFWKARLNGGTTLHQARAGDDYKSDEEIANAARQDPEKHWISVDTKKLTKLADAVYFLDARGFLFYAPAFMILGLREVDENEGLETEVAIAGWSRLAEDINRYESMRRKKDPKIRVSTKQKQAALAYIDYMIDRRGSPSYCSDDALAAARTFLQS